jgi:GH15 family glucan-1,4-alpha-glucosidase
LAENQQLKARVQALDTGYISEYGARLQTQEAAVKNAYRSAHETGDTEAMLTAQEDLAKIVVERQRYATAKSRSDAQAEQALAPRQQQAAPQPPTPDPKAQAWAEKNKWFGDDRVMTVAAFAINQELIDEQGFDPASNEYYSEIDRRIRSEFPHKFSAKNPGGGSQVASAVSSASRNTKQERRTVRLTPSQVAMAKRLNVPLDQYAKYVKD